MTDVGALYRSGRERISGLLRDAGEAGADTVVPACPEWTVRNLVSHLSGVCADIINGNLDGVATEPWTARQVEERKDRTVDEILAEWDGYATQCEAICHNFGGAEVQWLADITTHEHDIRGALNKPGERDSEAVKTGFSWLGERMSVMSEGNLPPLRVMTDEGDELLVGKGEPVASVKASRFDLFRAMTGRRSIEQVDEFEWNGDRGGYFEGRWGPFQAAVSRIVE